MRLSSVLFTLVIAAGCSSAGPQPSYQLDFRRFTRADHIVWFDLLASRYGCDTVLLKLPPRTPLGVGVTVCSAAAQVLPEVLRVWADSTGLVEQWDFHSTFRTAPQGVGNPDAPWWKAGTACRLDLEGTGPPYLLVKAISC